jgi:hypothetical protein
VKASIRRGCELNFGTPEGGGLVARIGQKKDFEENNMSGNLFASTAKEGFNWADEVEEELGQERKTHSNFEKIMLKRNRIGNSSSSTN